MLNYEAYEADVHDFDIKNTLIYTRYFVVVKTSFTPFCVQITYSILHSKYLIAHPLSIFAFFLNKKATFEFE
jgi:hypothetical protein